MLTKWLGSLAGLAGRFAATIASSLSESERSFWRSNRLHGVFGGAPAAGLDVTQENALTIATVFACTQARAETLASLPPMVYLEVGNNARRRSSGNPVWDLLHDSPNPEMDSMVFYELMSTRLINRGNGFAEIVRNGKDQPVELWPLHNSRVEPYRDRDGYINWRIYTDSIDPRYEEHRWYSIPDRNMLNIVGFNSNGYLGSGVIPVAVEQLSANLAMTQYSASWFKKGAHPSAVVSHPGYIDDDDERAEFRADMNRMHTGRDRWHEIPILWENAKWQQIQYSPEQSQLIATKGYGDKEICRYYKVPPAIVQIFDDYKFSTVDAMIQQFVMTCIRADAVRFERAIARQVLRTRDGRGVLREIFDDPFVFEFVIEALLRGDAKKQAETLEIERRNGILNANEWRSLSNREPLPDNQGEIYTVVGGFENLATLGKTYPSGRKKSESKSDGDEDQSNKLASFNLGRLIQGLEAGVPKHHDRRPGASASEATTVRDELDKAAVSVAAEAYARIGAITEKELEKAGGDDSRIAAVWQKHVSRLESAVLPACQLFCKYRDGLDAAGLAASMAGFAGENQLLEAVALETFERHVSCN